MKKCSRCGKTLQMNSDYFYRSKQHSTGFTSACKVCMGRKYTNHLSMPDGYKKCSNCKEIKSINQYSIVDGRYIGRCKDCVAKSAKEYYEKNKTQINRYKKEYYEKNKEQIKADAREYHYKHRDKRIRSAKQWRDKNTGKVREYNKRYKEENADLVREINQKRNARLRGLISELNAGEWSRVLKDFNYECAYCGIDEKKHIELHNEKLHQEHFLPLVKGGEYTHNNIIPACKNCNSSKRDSSFFSWYPRYEYYSKEREQRILDYLGYEKQTNTQQLALF